MGLHHLFYKGAAGPLGLQGCATPGAASPGAGPLGFQGVPPPLEAPRLAATLLAAGPRGVTPPIYCTPPVEQYRHPIPLLSHGNQSQFFFSLPLTLAAASAWLNRRLLLDAAASTGSLQPRLRVAAAPPLPAVGSL
jgi:hypothetical protein